MSEFLAHGNTYNSIPFVSLVQCQLQCYNATGIYYIYNAALPSLLTIWQKRALQCFVDRLFKKFSNTNTLN